MLSFQRLLLLCILFCNAHQQTFTSQLQERSIFTKLTTRLPIYAAIFLTVLATPTLAEDCDSNSEIADQHSSCIKTCKNAGLWDDLLPCKGQTDEWIEGYCTAKTLVENKCIDDQGMLKINPLNRLFIEIARLL